MGGLFVFLLELLICKREKRSVALLSVRHLMASEMAATSKMRQMTGTLRNLARSVTVKLI